MCSRNIRMSYKQFSRVITDNLIEHLIDVAFKCLHHDASDFRDSINEPEYYSYRYLKSEFQKVLEKVE